MAGENGARPTETVEKILKIAGTWSAFTGEAPPAPLPPKAEKAPEPVVETPEPVVEEVAAEEAPVEEAAEEAAAEEVPADEAAAEGNDEDAS